MQLTWQRCCRVLEERTLTCHCESHSLHYSTTRRLHCNITISNTYASNDNWILPGAQLYIKKWWWQGSGTYGESVEREPITGFWGQRPQQGPGAEPLMGIRGEAPLKLKGFDKTTSKSVHKFFHRKKQCVKNFRLHVKKRWWQSPPLLKVVVTCHHRHIQSCAYEYYRITSIYHKMTDR